jgi:hypothetical protein
MKSNKAVGLFLVIGWCGLYTINGRYLDIFI